MNAKEFSVAAIVLGLVTAIVNVFLWRLFGPFIGFLLTLASIIVFFLFYLGIRIFEYLEYLTESFEQNAVEDNLEEIKEDIKSYSYHEQKGSPRKLQSPQNSYE